MLNPQPVSFRLQRNVIAPAALALLALVVAAVAWLQAAQPASAVPVPYYRDYSGTATVKIKNGAAWQSFPMTVCATVETNGPNGDITDIIAATLQGEACDASESTETFQVVPAIPGAFSADTKIDLIDAGSGWKTPPTKQTASQWQFKLQTVNVDAASVYLNNAPRAMTSNTTWTVKFLNNRQGLYFKIAGFAPLNDNGLPKVTVEIETLATGLDSPPTVTNITPADGSSDVDSDTSVVFTYDEPVNVDPAGASITCISTFQEPPAVFNLLNANLNILGQGTTTITLDPTTPLPYGDNWTCTASISFDAVDDVDTNDPPANWLQSGGSTTFTMFGDLG